MGSRGLVHPLREGVGVFRGLAGQTGGSRRIRGGSGCFGGGDGGGEELSRVTEGDDEEVGRNG